MDDDPDVLQIVAGALERTARLTSVASLRDARQVLRQDRFDLVILDLTLRDGSGAEHLSELNVGGSMPPVIIFSAEDAQSAAAGLVDAFLTKSRTPLDELVGLVERLATRNRAQAG